jgi:hypothetical protein
VSATGFLGLALETALAISCGCGCSGSTTYTPCKSDTDCGANMACDPSAMKVGDGYCTALCSSAADCNHRVDCPSMAAEASHCDNVGSYAGGKGYCDQFGGNNGPHTCASARSGTGGTSGGGQTGGGGGGSSGTGCTMPDGTPYQSGDYDCTLDHKTITRCQNGTFINVATCDCTVTYGNYGLTYPTTCNPLSSDSNSRACQFAGSAWCMLCKDGQDCQTQ